MATDGPSPEAKFYNIVVRAEIGQKPIGFQRFLLPVVQLPEGCPYTLLAMSRSTYF